MNFTPRAFAAAIPALTRSDIDFGFIFGDRRQNMDGQSIGLRKVRGDELQAALHQLGDETDVAAKAIKPGDHQSGAMDSTGPQRFVQLRAIGF